MGLEPDAAFTTPDTRSGVALIERVVIIEQQQKQLGLDTAAIRSTLHDIRNELQKLAYQEFQRTGQTSAVKLMGSLLLGAVVIGSAIASLFSWLLPHFK